MSAREFLINHLWAGRVTVPRATEMVDGYRAAVLAEDGQAYDGELAMYRQLVRTLSTVIRDGSSAEKQRAEVERLLHQHAADDAEAREKSSRPAADATPDFFHVGHTNVTDEVTP
ncbi:MAG: hypothetical protein HOV92_18075 [Streptomyces sp.]|nr:hypothetical protein [Streptomyces sp.]